MIITLEIPGLALARDSKAVDAGALGKIVGHLSALVRADIHLLVAVGFQNLQMLIQHGELHTDRYTSDVIASLLGQANAMVLYAELKKMGFQPKLLSPREVQTSALSETYSPALAATYAAQEQIVLCNAPVSEGGLFDEDLSAATKALDVSATALCKAVPPGSLAHLGAGNGSVLFSAEDIVVGTCVLPFSRGATALCRTHHLPIILFDPTSTVSVADSLRQGLQPPDLVAALK